MMPQPMISYREGVDSLSPPLLKQLNSFASIFGDSPKWPLRIGPLK